MLKNSPKSDEMASIVDSPTNKNVQEVDEVSEGGGHHHGGLTVLTATVFMVGEMAGSGLLALPKALDNISSWIGIVLTIGCCLLSAYTGKILGAAWVLVQERYPEYRGHVRYPYPAIGQVTYGKKGRYAVSFCINFTMFGAGVVYLLLAAENVQDLIKDAGRDISFCYWLLLLTAVLLPVTWFGSPKDFWFIAIAAAIATSVASLVLVSNVIVDAVNSHRTAYHSKFHFKDFFVAFGTICFAFGGHPAFPTFQTDMKEQKKFGVAVLLAYLIVLMMYLPVSVAAYFVYGDAMKDNILRTVSHGPMLYTVQILITAHLLFAFIIVINPVCQEVEEFAKIPKKFTWKRMISRTLMMAAILFFAETIPHFSNILSLIGGSTLTLLAYVFPSLFYLKLCKMEGDWESIPVPLHTTVLNFEILAVGAVVGVASTYSGVSNMAAPGSFTVPCYVNISAAEG